jgi:hypothetical protein
MHRPSGGTTEVAVLPRAARPAHLLDLIVSTNGYTTGTVLIYPNGRVYAYGPQARTFTSLAGLSYPVAATATRKLTLINGWQSEQSIGTGSPAYSLIGGVVYLSGSLHQPTGSSDTFAVLPQGVRPTHYLVFKVWTNGDVVGFVQVLPNGEVSAFGATGSKIFTSLAGISYPRNA